MFVWLKPFKHWKGEQYTLYFILYIGAYLTDASTAIPGAIHYNVHFISKDVNFPCTYRVFACFQYPRYVFQWSSSIFSNFLNGYQQSERIPSIVSYISVRHRTLWCGRRVVWSCIVANSPAFCGRLPHFEKWKMYFYKGGRPLQNL